MKKLFLIAVLIGSTIVLYGQKVGIGLKASADWVNTEEFDDNPTYINYGVTLDLKLKPKFILHFDAVHSSRKFEEKLGTILTANDILDSSTSEYQADFKEKVFEFSTGLRIKLLGSAPISPFIGAGAVMQLPYGYDGVRRLVSTSGRVQNFEFDTFKESSNAIFGAYPAVGAYVSLGKIDIMAEVRYKFYFNSNYYNYRYPSVNSIVEDNHTSLEAGLAFIVRI